MAKKKNFSEKELRIVEIFSKMREAIPAHSLKIEVIEATKLLLADCLVQGSLTKGERAVFLLHFAGEMSTLCNIVEEEVNKSKED